MMFVKRHHRVRDHRHKDNINQFFECNNHYMRILRMHTLFVQFVQST